MPSPSVTSKASKKSRKSHKTAEKPSKQHKGPAEKVSKETVARVKKVVQNDVDDTGAPAHRVSAKLHRAQKTPHTEVTAPKPIADAKREERLSNFTIPSAIAASRALSLTSKSTTPPVLSKFERALVLGHRARELAVGGPTLAPVSSWEPGNIALKELEMGLLDDYALSRATHGDTSLTQSEEWLLGDFKVL